MKLLFSIPDEIECVDGKYYSNPISIMVNRYSIICNEMICYAPIVKKENPSSDLIKNEIVSFRNAPKINSVKSLLNRNRYYREIKALVEECDAVIVHVHTSLIGTMVTNVANRLKKPYLTVVVGCAWDSLWNHGIKGKLMAPWAFFNLRRVQQNASYSIYVTRSFLQNRYSTKGKYISCSNVELSNITSEIEERKLRIKKGVLTGRNIVTLAATDVPYKGQQYVIKAIKRLKKIGIKYMYYIVGNGNPSRLKKIAEISGVSDQVIFVGPLPHKKIIKFLGDMDIYIQPSKQEGLPRALIEAMSCGCYCLGSKIAGIPELLGEKFMFRKGSVNDIVNHLSDITIEDRISQVEINVKVSSFYKKDILDERRNKFLTEFRDSISI